MSFCAQDSTEILKNIENLVLNGGNELNFEKKERRMKDSNVQLHGDYYFYEKPLVVILNIERNREGSEYDVINIKKYFSIFNFEIEIMKISSKKEFEIKYGEILKKQFDFFILFVMGHGRLFNGNDYLYLSDGEEKSEMESEGFETQEDNEEIKLKYLDVNKFFINKILKKKHLKEIPKIFFFQICRGDNISFFDSNYKSRGDERKNSIIMHSTLKGWMIDWLIG